MTLPVSGPLSMTMVAAELGISAAGLHLNDSRVRALAAKPSGAIAYGDLRGKSAFTPGLTGSGATYEYNDGTSAGTVTMTAETDGRLRIVSPTDTFTFQWGAPTTTGIGSNYWVRFTLTGSSATGTGTGAPSASTGWLQLSSARSVSVSATKVGTSGSRIVTGTYTVEIATDAAGANIVATGTGYTLRVVAVPL